eukprot:CAMPEP_0195654938 /NCGR_PEP_ID=MMETSP0815-20121206/34186_1 /TAXON_ID=97485 /ORGANISM="Prymnesium parvum, Strain Texoma1" /LENGTH=263 /DNA_ID=CAMNT_0040799181 /DNA_START=50 /DNA_END=841 /DNA_ORIENTATION=-
MASAAISIRLSAPTACDIERRTARRRGDRRRPPSYSQAAAGSLRSRCSSVQETLCTRNGVPLGPEMARGAFESRLPIGAIFDAIESVSLKELVTWCLSSPQHPLLHLAGLSIMSGATAGAHKCHPDESMLEATRMEFLGRPIGANATVWPEHAELLMEFLEPSYASRYGAPMARLVQRRVLADVVVTDFHAIASNSKRKPDAKVVDLFHALKRSPYEEIRSIAADVGGAMAEMLRSGEQNQQTHVEVANKKHMEELCDLLDSY